MSNGSHHKNYHYEVTPPAGVWEKINSALDEAESGALFPSRLRNFETIPPPEAWSKIAAVLYGSSFIHNYATRLAALEVTPPPSAWNKIQASLDNEVVEEPVSKKVIPWFRYAAAAALIGLIAWGGSRILNSNNTAPQQVAEKTPVNNPVNTPVITETVTSNDLPATPETTSEEADEARNNAALEASKKTFARLDIPRSSKIKNAAAFYFAPETETGTTRGLDLEAQEMEKININNRYIVFMTPEGNIIRMSKKLSDLVCCVSGEIEEQDCVDQMKKWREKIAYTFAGHSPGNFLEVLNLVCSLEEE